MTNIGPATGISRTLALCIHLCIRLGGNPGANLKSISHGCYLREVAFEWELTDETIHLPLCRLQDGSLFDLSDKTVPVGQHQRQQRAHHLHVGLGFNIQVLHISYIV